MLIEDDRVIEICKIVLHVLMKILELFNYLYMYIYIYIYIYIHIYICMSVCVCVCVCVNHDSVFNRR